MTRLTIYIKDKSIAKLIENLCDKLTGIYMLEHDEFDKNGNKTGKSFAKILGNKKLVTYKTELDEAIEEIKSGKLKCLDSVLDLNKLLEE